MDSVKERLMAAVKLPPREQVEVPGFSEPLFVHAVPASHIDWAVEKRGEVRQRVIAVTLHDEQGNLIFDRDDLEVIDSLGIIALKKISIAANRLNGMSSEEDGDEEKN